MCKNNDKGRWTPPEFFKLPQLSCLDRFVLSCIYGLDDNGCIASNQYIGNLIACTKRQVMKSITKMARLGYVSVEIGDDNCTRKIFCKIMVDRGTQTCTGGVPKKVGGEYLNGSAVFEGLTSSGKPETPVFLEDTVDIQENSTVQKGNSHKELGEENTPYQTQVETHKMEWRPTMGKHLTSFASKAMSLGKPLQFGGKGAWVEEEFNRLVHRHGEDRLLIVLRASVAKCGDEYPTLSFNFFKSKITELRLNEIPQMASAKVVKKTEAEQLAEFRRMGLGSRAIPRLTTQQNV